MGQTNRRGFLRTLGISGATLGAAGSKRRRADAAAKSKRPNVLFIFTDDQREDTINALGNPHIQTPHLDELAHNGVVFTNGYCTGGFSAAVLREMASNPKTSPSDLRVSVADCMGSVVDNRDRNGFLRLLREDEGDRGLPWHPLCHGKSLGAVARNGRCVTARPYPIAPAPLPRPHCPLDKTRRPNHPHRRILS